MKQKELKSDDMYFQLEEDGMSQVRICALKKDKDLSVVDVSAYAECLMYRIFYDFDCTGEWFTRRYEIFRTKGYWLIRFFDYVDC